MFAIRRLNSDNKKDFSFGLKNIYYNAMSLLTIVLLIIIEIKYESKFVADIFFVTFLISFVLAAFVTKDYKKIRNVHRGTLEYYIHEINMPNDIITKKAKNFKQVILNIFDQFYFLLASANILFFYGALVSGHIHEIMLDIFNIKLNLFQITIMVLLFSLWTIFVVKISMGLIADKIKNIKVSQDMIKEYIKIDNLNEEEKDVFMKYMKNLIQEKGFVTKKDLYEWCLRIQRILDYRKKDDVFKEEEKLSKKYEYQDILDYENLKI